MKMKLAVIALSGAVLMSGAASALDCDPRFYVGAEAQANRYNGGAKKLTDKDGDSVYRTDRKSMFKKEGSGLGLFLGTRLNEFLGLEAGYNFMSGGKLHAGKFSSNTTVKMPKAKHRNMYADVLGYVPVCEDIDLIGSLGVGRLSTKISGNLEERNARGRLVNEFGPFAKSSKTGVRFGLGVGYNINENLSARLMVRNQKGNKYIKNVTSAGLGLMYSF